MGELVTWMRGAGYANELVTRMSWLHEWEKLDTQVRWMRVIYANRGAWTHEQEEWEELATRMREAGYAFLPREAAHFSWHCQNLMIKAFTCIFCTFLSTRIISLQVSCSFCVVVALSSYLALVSILLNGVGRNIIKILCLTEWCGSKKIYLIISFGPKILSLSLSCGIIRYKFIGPNSEEEKKKRSQGFKVNV